MERVDEDVDIPVNKIKRETAYPNVIATWNVNLITYTSKKYWNDILKEVFRYNTDLVVFQEIPMPPKNKRRDKECHQDVELIQKTFLKYINNASISSMDCLVSNRLGQSYQCQESHAIFFLTSKYNFLEAYEGFDDPKYGAKALKKERKFCRNPFTVFFEEKKTGTVFSLTSFHVKHGSTKDCKKKRQKELKAMAKGMKMLKSFEGHENTSYHIFAGDFNTPVEEMKTILDKHNEEMKLGKFHILKPRKNTLKSSIVDYFIIFQHEKEKGTVNSKEVDVKWPVCFNNMRQMSDHRLVVFEWGIN